MPTFNRTYSWDEKEKNPNLCAVCGAITPGGINVKDVHCCSIQCYIFNQNHPNEKNKNRMEVHHPKEHESMREL